MKQVYLWADASKSIGYGHFVRTLALANILKNKFDCTFFTQTPTEYQRSEVLKVCKLYELPANDSKFNIFLEQLIGDEIVVLDNFFFFTEYQKKIKEIGCKLVSLGLNDRHYYSDVVISQASTDVHSFSGESYTNYCLGLNWALLRLPFYNVDQSLCQRGDGVVFVGFGGSDFNDLSFKVALSLLNESAINTINVLVGDSYKGHIKEINDCRLKIYNNLDAYDIVKLLSTCEMSVVSSSSICIESMACKVPTFAGYYVDNQIPFYNILCSNNSIVGLGNLLNNDFSDLVSKMKTMPNLKLPNIDFSNIPNNYINLFRGLC